MRTPRRRRSRTRRSRTRRSRTRRSRIPRGGSQMGGSSDSGDSPRESPRTPRRPRNTSSPPSLGNVAAGTKTVAQAVRQHLPQAIKGKFLQLQGVTDVWTGLTGQTLPFVDGIYALIDMQGHTDKLAIVEKHFTLCFDIIQMSMSRIRDIQLSQRQDELESRLSQLNTEPEPTSEHAAPKPVAPAPGGLPSQEEAYLKIVYIVKRVILDLQNSCEDGSLTEEVDELRFKMFLFLKSLYLCVRLREIPPEILTYLADNRHSDNCPLFVYPQMLNLYQHSVTTSLTEDAASLMNDYTSPGESPKPRGWASLGSFLFRIRPVLMNNLITTTVPTII